METREIGNSGIEVSVVGLGCNNFGLFKDAAQANACIHKALDLGITLFDMASEHGAGTEEELVCAALGTKRKQVIIATKFGQQELLGIDPGGALHFSTDKTRQGTSRRWIMQSVEESLRRLDTDYIDLYQPHVLDEDTAPEETVQALDDLVRQGKVRAIGMAVNQGQAKDLVSLQEAAEANTLTRFESMQAEYNLLNRTAETQIIPELRKRKMSLLPYFPLANGVLAGKYQKGISHPAGSRLDKLQIIRGMYNDEHLDTVEGLRDFAHARNLTLVELAIAWLLSEPVVASVIAGATNPEQVEQNTRAAGTRLPEADREALDRLLSARGITGFF